MSGVTLTIDIDDVAAQAALERIEANADDLAVLLEEIGSYLEFSTRERFETGAAPDGSKWKPPARGGQPLVLSTRLMGSINYQVAAPQVMVGTNVIYGRAHQEGMTITAKDGGALRFQVAGQWRMVKSVTLPRRAFLGLSKADEDEIGTIATEWLLRGVGGSGAPA